MDRRGSYGRRRSDGDTIAPAVTLRLGDGARTSGYRSLALQQVSRHQLSCLALQGGNHGDGDDGEDEKKKGERERERESS